MKIKNSFGYSCFTVFNTIFMVLLCIVTLYPLLFVVFASLSESNAFMMHEGLLLWPVKPNFESYLRVIENPMIWSGYRNTLVIMTVGTCTNMVMTILGAFFMSRKDVKGVGLFSKFIVFSMYFSGGLIPTYLNIRQFGLDGSFWALIIPFAVNTYNMIIMRTAFASVPDSLEESATLDGANAFTVLTRIILPLSGSTIAVVILYYVVGHWNAWFYASLFLRKREQWPLQLVLNEILMQNSTNSMLGDTTSLEAGSVAETIKYAVIVVSTIPILLAYPFLQRYFVKGVMVGAVKG
ncbi:MAG: carbohydrate ABC transporter permease [Ruminococcaceae bacterium]|nr:carbohydrate ABC transporter permease [Oscillospiraceae bacterium]